jgi:hypothetical protein
VVVGPRFLLEAGFIVAVAVFAGLAALSTWAIIGVVAAAWILVALVELAVWGVRARRRRVTAKKPEPTPEPPSIAAASPPLAPEAAPEPAPEPEAEPEPAVAYLPANDEPREWNLWELERIARENTSDDVATNEERAYLLMYLREFAGPDGTLPADFDGLVRDAFGDLLRVAL